MFGDTWHSEAKGFNKLTKIGWLAFFSAFLGFTISAIQVYQDQEKDKIVQRAAVFELRLVWRQLAGPFGSAIKMVNGESPVPFTKEDLLMWKSPDKRQLLQKISQYEKDLKAIHPLSLSWEQLFCQGTLIGQQKLIENIATFRKELDTKLIASAINVRNSIGWRAFTLIAPCGKLNVVDGFQTILTNDATIEYVQDLIRFSNELTEWEGQLGMKFDAHKAEQ